MKKLVFVFSLLCLVCTSLRAQDNVSIDGYFLVNGNPYYFFAEGVRDHAEYRVNNSDKVEIIITSPVTETIAWDIIDRGACVQLPVSNNGHRAIVVLGSSGGDIVLEATTSTSRLLITLYCN